MFAVRAVAHTAKQGFGTHDRETLRSTMGAIASGWVTVFAWCVLLLRRDMDAVWSIYIYMGGAHVGTRDASFLEHAVFV